MLMQTKHPGLNHPNQMMTYLSTVLSLITSLEEFWVKILLLLTYHSSCVSPCPSTLTQLG